MLDPAYRWDSVQNVPSSATTKFQGPIYTATPYSEEIAIFNTLSSTRKRYVVGVRSRWVGGGDPLEN